MTYSSEVLTDSPLAYYRQEETAGTVATDSSGNSGRDGTYIAPVTFQRPGLIDAGTAVGYNTGGSLRVGYAAWQEVDYCTLEAWVKPNVTNDAVIWARDDNGSSLVTRLDISGGKFRFIWCPAGQGYGSMFGTTNVTAGTVYHVVGIYDGATARLYVNGVQEASATVSGVLEKRPFGPGLTGGCAAVGTQLFLNGDLDELAFYGSALPAARVTAHYAARTTPTSSPQTIALGQATSTSVARTVAPLTAYPAAVLADTPLAYWRLADAAPNAVMVDSSGMGRNGTWGNSGASAPSLVQTETNAAATINGTGGAPGVVPVAAWMAPLSAVTLECWFKTSSSALQGLVGRSTAGAFGTDGAGSYRMYINSGEVTFNVFDSSYQPMFTLTGGSGLANGAAHHAVGTWDGTTARLFIDGTQVATTTASGTMAPLGTVAFYVGSMGSSFITTGVLDEVAVYNTALSPTRVTAHHAAAAAPPPPQTIALNRATSTSVARAVTGFRRVATRFYFLSGTSSAPTVAVSSTWNSPPTSKLDLGVAKIGSVNTETTLAASESSASAPLFSGAAYYVSAPGVITPRQATGDFTFVAKVEQLSNSLVTLYMRLAVFSEDGATLRGVLFEGTPTHTSIGTTPSTRVARGTLSPVNIQSGDRVVLELGGRFDNTTATGKALYIKRVASTALADFDPTDGQTAVLNPWFDLSLDEQLATAPPQVVALNRATSTSVARAVTGASQTVVALGRASSASAARAVTPASSIIRAVGRTTSVSVARAVTVVVPALPLTITMGRATSTGAARALIASSAAANVAVPMARIVGSGTAQPIGVSAPAPAAPAPGVSAPTRRWKLRDTATGVEWTMPINPDSMSSPLPRRSLKFGYGWRRDGRVRTFASPGEAVEWEWGGVIRSKDHYDRLVEWAEKSVAIDVTDHLGRTFRIFIAEFNPVDRRPTPKTPWRLRYTMKARVLERVG